jgi:predicted nucleic acid-binding protein
MPIFADTSYFLALLQPDGDFFQAANAFSQSNMEPLLTTSAILLELGNALSQNPDRGRFLEINSLIENGLIQSVFVPLELYKNAIDLFAKRSDKSWSLTDCISFVVMIHRNITDAATTDHHFAQAGFRVLLQKQKA